MLSKLKRIIKAAFIYRELRKRHNSRKLSLLCSLKDNTDAMPITIDKKRFQSLTAVAFYL